MISRRLFFPAILAVTFFLRASAQSVSNEGIPRLVVSIAVDQLRSDYLAVFSKSFTPWGFNRLMGQGTVYPSASYPFSPVDRASAIASIASGVSPYYNSVVGQRWLNRETLRPVWCVADERYRGLHTTETVSPENLSTSTLGDELKVATGGQAKVWSVAPFSDAAVLSVGHAADGALWIDDTRGEWCSSQYYMNSLPSWVSNVSPDVSSMALQCISATGMGTDDVTDLLCLTYCIGSIEESNGNSENKRYKREAVPAADNYQLQNTYVRLDAEIARLVETIERRLGRENVLFVLTSTGYCETKEEADYQKYRIPTGTFYMSRTADLLNMYLGAIWGQGKYVETTFRNHIFLNHTLLDSKKVSISNATSRAQELLVMMQGVRNVYTSLQLLTINNEQIQLVRSGYHPERCGDLVIETAPGWRVLTENTGESELLRASYFQFPIVFYGAKVEAMRVSQPVTTDRIAPTLARIMRVHAPNACSAEPLF